jgi:hypothetical protein
MEQVLICHLDKSNNQLLSILVIDSTFQMNAILFLEKLRLIMLEFTVLPICVWEHFETRVVSGVGISKYEAICKM